MIANEFDLDQAGSLVVVTVRVPQLSGMQVQELTAELSQNIRYNGGVYFVLDLKDVQFVDSSCLGVLVQFLQEVEHVRGRIALAHCQKNVVLLFKLTRLDSVFTIYDDLEEAKTSVLRG